MEIKNKRFVIASSILFIILLAIFGTCFLTLNRSSSSLTVSTSTAALVYPSIREVEDVVTMETLTPELTLDTSDEAFTNNSEVIEIDGSVIRPPIAIEKEIVEKIASADKEITNTKQTEAIAFIWSNSEYSLYYMTPDKKSCTFSEGLGIDLECPNAKLKIYDRVNNNVSLLSDAKFSGEVNLRALYLKNDHNFIIFGKIYDKDTKGKFIVYSPDESGAKIKTDKDSNVLNQYGYLIGYNKINNIFSVENLATHDLTTCKVEAAQLQAQLENNFDEGHFLISPNGKKFQIYSDKEGLLLYETNKCFDTPKVIPVPKQANISSLQLWYNNGSFIGSHPYSGKTFLYDLNLNRQILFRDWSFGTSTGLNNYGYHDTAQLTENMKLSLVPEDGSVAIYLQSNSKSFLLKRYVDSGSTKLFYDTLKLNPLNSNGGYTSHAFADISRPKTGFEVVNENGIFHVLVVMNGYYIRETFDLKIKGSL